MQNRNKGASWAENPASSMLLSPARQGPRPYGYPFDSLRSGVAKRLPKSTAGEKQENTFLWEW